MSLPSLAALQRAFRDHVLGSDATTLTAVAVGDRIAALARLQIYRNHVMVSLTAALGATFSTVRGVVGAARFDGLARAFIVRSPPAGPVLSEYGAALTDFIATWPGTSSLHYLADVARLDWALNQAYGAPNGPGLTAVELADLPPDRLAALRPGLRVGVSVLASRYPLDRIWALNHGNDATAVDLDAGGVRLLVFPRDDDAAFLAVDEGTAVLAGALSDGHSLSDAVERALAVQADLDVGAALGRLLSLRALGSPDRAL